MLLRVGVIAISFSIMLALAVVAILALRDGTEAVVVAEPVAASPEPTTGQEYKDPRDKMLDLPSPEVEPDPESEAEPEAEPASQSKLASDPKPRQRSSLPVVEEDWPVPDRGEIEAAEEPRKYDWIPGAIMTLTVDAMNITNAPVLGSDSQQALENGVAHVPETSLPWTRSPHRNVYLAGHRLGWPGTGSRLIFYNLDRLRNGDKVFLKDRRGKRYRYKVTDKFVVGPDERWVMGQELNRDMVTLQTCVGPNFSKRLIVRADRVKS